VKTLAVARRPTSAPDGVLVQEAAAGGGASYAALYDRYSEQVYNYCLRLTGSPEDAADATQDAFVNVLRRLQEDDRPVLNFSAYLFAAARNESYALMRRRNRTQPTEDVPELAAAAALATATPDVETDPERAAMLQASQEQVQEANAQLPPRHREVLALREVAGRSYEEIGQIMGISENAAAQLIWRARAKLKEALTAGAVASVVAATDDCETAQLLLNRLHDGEPITDEEQEWLDEHLEECERCRAARGMIFEMGASYRAWAPVAVLVALKPQVLTEAGSVIGADWSGVAGKAGAGISNGAAGGAAAGVAVLAAAGIAISGLLHDDAKVAPKAAPAEQAPAASAPASKPASKPAKAKPKPAKPPPVKAASARSLKETVPPAEPAGPPAPPPSFVAPEPRSAPPPPEKPKPNPPASPEPKVQPPPKQTAPPPPPPTAPTTGECTFPGNGGPGGCPPGHGGIPPGQGGVPPGQSGKPSPPPGQVGKP
jgi:RNA polymerase sigma factor (sigma-70 family)